MVTSLWSRFFGPHCTYKHTLSHRDVSGTQRKALCRICRSSCKVVGHPRTRWTQFVCRLPTKFRVKRANTFLLIIYPREQPSMQQAYWLCHRHSASCVERKLQWEICLMDSCRQRILQSASYGHPQLQIGRIASLMLANAYDLFYFIQPARLMNSSRHLAPIISSAVVSYLVISVRPIISKSTGRQVFRVGSTAVDDQSEISLIDRMQRSFYQR